MIKPVLKWVGGKSKLREVIYSSSPKHFINYYEPFLGGASFALEIFAQKNCNLFLRDINPDPINLYLNIKNNYERLVFLLNEIKKDFIEGDRLKVYNVYRDIFNESSTDSLVRSAIFYFLNKTSFNGVVRYNSKGGFNVPFGKRDFNIEEDKILEFKQFASSERVCFEQGNYQDISPKKYDFVYLDPPYHPISITSNFTGYHNDSGWNQEKEEQLKLFCDTLTSDGVYFILSNNDVPFIRDLFKQYKFTSVDVTKSVGAKSETRKKSPEVLIKNYD